MVAEEIGIKLELTDEPRKELDRMTEEKFKPNPVKALLMSRKFLVLILDTVIALVTYFVTKYANPGATEDVMMVIGVLQPVFVALIAMIAYEDAAALKAAANGVEEVKLEE